jgi:NAD+-dependent protein deacetylase SIR2
MDSSRAANGKSANGNTNGLGAAAGKKTSSRLKNVVNYDEKQHLADLEDDIQHGVAHTNLTELEERVNDLHESWETESLFEDALEDLTEDKFFTDGNYYS